MPSNRSSSKKNKKIQASGQRLDPIYQIWGWILLVWSLYRNYLHLPEWVDEFLAKPLVFVVPVFWYVKRIEKRALSSIGLTSNKLFSNIYLGLGFGVLFAVEGIAANAIKYGKLQFNPISVVGQYGVPLLMVLSLATAVSEEILARGFIFNRLYEKSKNLAFASFISTILFVLLHVPILLTTLKYQGMTLILFFLTDFILGMANALLFFNTGSLVAPILVHLFWNMTVALYL